MPLTTTMRPKKRYIVQLRTSHCCLQMATVLFVDIVTCSTVLDLAAVSMLCVDLDDDPHAKNNAIGMLPS